MIDNILEKLIYAFTDHPHSVNETYLTHMKFALILCMKLFILSYVCLIHSIFPFLFEYTVSTKIKELSEMLETRSKN